jgi:hypothetical protein
MLCRRYVDKQPVRGLVLYPPTSPLFEPLLQVRAPETRADGMQRNFEPMQKQVTAWKVQHILDEDAKLAVFRAFIQEYGFLKHLARFFHNYYFNPEQPEFAPRTM